MSFFFQATIILFSLFILFQDLKERRVSIWILVCFSILLGVEAFWERPTTNIFKSTGLNISFLLIEFLIASLYYFLRYRDIKKLFRSVGGADLWFVLTLSISFSTVNFILFLTTSLFLSLFIYVVYRAFSAKMLKQIPLAGFIALFYCVSRIIMYFYSPLAIWNDDWIVLLMGE